MCTFSNVHRPMSTNSPMTVKSGRRAVVLVRQGGPSPARPSLAKKRKERREAENRMRIRFPTLQNEGKRNNKNGRRAGVPLKRSAEEDRNGTEIEKIRWTHLTPSFFSSSSSSTSSGSRIKTSCQPFATDHSPPLGIESDANVDIWRSTSSRFAQGCHLIPITTKLGGGHESPLEDLNIKAGNGKVKFIEYCW